MNGNSMNEKKILTFIPARGGSKGVPRKNIRHLHGKPLIAWTIEEAKKSRYLDRIIVSTEDKEIAEVSKRFGAEVPFLRPEELARDESPTMDCVVHALDWLKDHEGYVPDLFLLLEATVPLRIAQDIDNAIEIMIQKMNKIDAVISVKEVSEHPYWMSVLDEDGFISDFIKPDKEYARRQDLPPAYIVNGAIYLSKTEVLLSKKTFTPKRTYGYVMPRERSVDIDSEADFKFAEYLMNR